MIGVAQSTVVKFEGKIQLPNPREPADEISIAISITPARPNFVE